MGIFPILWILGQKGHEQHLCEMEVVPCFARCLVFIEPAMPNTVCLCSVHRIVSKIQRCKCYIGSVIPLTRLQSYWLLAVKKPTNNSRVNIFKGAGTVGYTPSGLYNQQRVTEGFCCYFCQLSSTLTCYFSLLLWVILKITLPNTVSKAARYIK